MYNDWGMSLGMKTTYKISKCAQAFAYYLYISFAVKAFIVPFSSHRKFYRENKCYTARL